MMNKQIEMIKGLRLYLLRQIEGLTATQLNEIPTGYNNNIIWNLLHLISVQQSLCYIRTNQAITVDDKYFSPYQPGTKPERFIDEAEITAVKELFIRSIDRLQADFDNNRNMFDQYSPSVRIPQVYGFEVNNIDDTLVYILHHEGLHTGVIFSLKKQLKNI